MKKAFTVLLCALLVLSLAGCGGTKAENAEPAAAPDVTEAPASAEAPAATGAPPATEAPAESDTGDIAALVEQILAMVGQPVEDLYELAGQPTGNVDYSSSCLVTGGKDGQLEYDGFTVYTLVQPDGTETIYDCLID